MPYPQKSLPPLEWIRAFEAAGRTGSFTLAAAETGLTQAAISQRIRNLENYIGASLFDRQARGVALTVDGEAWLPYVANALSALTRSADDLFAKPLKRIGVLASTSLIELWFAPRLKGFQTNFQLSFHTLHTKADIAREDYGVQVRYGKGDWSDHRARLLYQEELAPMASPELAKQVSRNWADLPHIAVSGPRPGWMEWALLAGRPAPPPPILRFDSFGQAMAAAKAGAGVFLGSVPLCRHALEKGDLIQLSDVVLKPTEGFWMTSSIGRIPTKQWDALAKLATSQPL